MLGVSGLRVYRSFLGSEAMLGAVVDLHRRILNCAKNAEVRRARSFLSQQHNLRSNEMYQLVRVDDSLNAQHFKEYGEAGHSLTYFIGNANIPSFVRDGLIAKVMQMPEVRALGGGLDWNFTFNAYSAVDGKRMAGFAYHKDIESNGVVTMIYSLGAQSMFHIRHPERRANVREWEVVSDSLVLLSGDARWEHEHCVVPVSVPLGDGLVGSGVQRFSLVLGCKKIFDGKESS